jgi:Tfp pilus assembly protein PilX
MKTKIANEQGSVLMTALLTITLLTIISATSLYVTSQNANATTQTASWQQALAGAEGAVDQAMSTLNSYAKTAPSNAAWTTATTPWYTAPKPLPVGKPNSVNPIPASGPPASGYYNYYFPSTLSTSSPSGTGDESGMTVTSWVTIDDGCPVGGSCPNPLQAPSGYQEYRIRATGVVGAPGPARVSNQKLDNQLRKISLRFDRFTGNAVSTPQAARRIEVIATPVVSKNDFSFVRAITTQTWTQMTGSNSVIDSFDSRSAFKSNPLGTYSPYAPYRQSHGDVGLVDSSKNNNVSDLKNNLIYGNLQYSGPAVKRTAGVQGTVSTPFTATFPAASDPTATFTNYNSNPNDATIVVGSQSEPTLGTKDNPMRLKITDNFSLQKNFTITAPAPPPPPPSGTPAPVADTYLEMWVTGNYTTSGQGVVTQAPGVHVTWYVDGDISTAGGAYVNQSNVASNLSFIAVGAGSITISGDGNLIGTFYGPSRDVSFTGNGSLMGAVIGADLKITSGASIHYDEALASAISFANPVFSNYAYASWFEDNSDPARSIAY